MPEYTNEQLQMLYKQLPKELQEVITSVETADRIWEICEKNEIKEVSLVAKRVGNVLVGVLSLGELQKVLEEELKLDKEPVKRIVRDINRFIFNQVKTELEELYRLPTKKKKSKTLHLPSQEEDKKFSDKELTSKKPEIDPYRESIE